MPAPARLIVEAKKALWKNRDFHDGAFWGKIFGTKIPDLNNNNKIERNFVPKSRFLCQITVSFVPKIRFLCQKKWICAKKITVSFFICACVSGLHGVPEIFVTCQVEVWTRLVTVYYAVRYDLCAAYIAIIFQKQ